MTHDEMIAAIQAHKEGKPIQFRGINEKCEQDWLGISDPTFRFHDCVYRVKPEPPKPREFWAVFPEGNLRGFGAVTFYACKQILLPGQGQIHVREVVEAPSVSNGNETL